MRKLHTFDQQFVFPKMTCAKFVLFIVLVRNLFVCLFARSKKCIFLLNLIDILFHIVFKHAMMMFYIVFKGMQDVVELVFIDYGKKLAR